MAQENVVLPVDKYQRLMEKIKKCSEPNVKETPGNHHGQEVSQGGFETQDTLLTSDTPNNKSSDMKEDHQDKHISPKTHEKSNSDEHLPSEAMPPGMNVEDMLQRTQAKRKPKLPKTLPNRLKRNQKSPAKGTKKRKKKNLIFDNWIIFNKKK